MDFFAFHYKNICLKAIFLSATSSLYFPASYLPRMQAASSNRVLTTHTSHGR